MPISSEGHTQYRFDAFTLDLDRGALLREGEEIALRPKSFEVLRHLVTRQGVLVTREEMLSAIWPDVVVSDDSLTQCLIDVRRALGDENRSLIRTIPRRGFIFEPEVEHVIESAATGSSAVDRKFTVTALVVSLAMLSLFTGWWYISNTPVRQDNTIVSGHAESILSVNSIAVLNFKDMGPDDEQIWFVDGLAEEIRNLLASLPELKVIGRSSSSAVKQWSEDLRDIGKALGARYLLEGSVKHDADLVRISVQLIDSHDGTMVWSDSYNSSKNDLFALQENVAAAVLDALKIEIISYPTRGFPTKSSEAYAMFLRAKLALNIQDAVTAESELQSALELDPGFAEAWELLAHTYWTEPDPTLSWMETFKLINDAAGRALAIDPSREFASVLYLESTTVNYSTAKMIAAFLEATDQQWNNPAFLRTISWHLVMVGYPSRAIRYVNQWVEIDPLSSIAHVRLAAVLRSMGRGHESINELLVAHRLSDGDLDWYLGEAYLVRGEDELAIRHFEAALDQFGYTDKQWLSNTILDVQAHPESLEKLDQGVLLAKSRLQDESVSFIEPALNRWYFFFGFIDRYFQIIHEAIQDDLRWEAAQFYIWYGVIFPELGFTAHPGYLELAKRFGLVDVWEQLGAPDRCEKLAGDWVCN